MELCSRQTAILTTGYPYQTVQATTLSAREIMTFVLELKLTRRADSRAVGCIWTWSLDEDSDTPVTVSPLPTSLLTAGPSSTLPSSSSSLGDVV